MAALTVTMMAITLVAIVIAIMTEAIEGATMAGGMAMAEDMVITGTHMIADIAMYIIAAADQAIEDTAIEVGKMMKKIKEVYKTSFIFCLDR
jgi:hypothetical protein